MSDIQTWEDVMASFVTRFDGTRGTHDEDDIRLLVAGMRARPWDSNRGYLQGRDMRPAEGWNAVFDRGLMFRGSCSGWVTRQGMMLGADLASHERLLDYLGLVTADVEKWGWARVTASRLRGYRCLLALSRAQANRIEECGILVDKGYERIQPRFPAMDMPAAWAGLPAETQAWLTRPWPPGRNRPDAT